MKDETKKDMKENNGILPVCCSNLFITIEN
jgi:hypothetical protein